MRGNVPGEWRYWGGDAWSTRYSPLDQINASNFGKLKVAWQWNAGAFGQDEYYRTTPLYANGRLFTVATTRRIAAAIDPENGETLWMWRMDEGIRWQKAPRQFAGRGPAYWTDGASERVIVATPGYHLASLDAKTGLPDPKFGKNGIVDLMDGLGFPLVPLAVDDAGPLVISDAAPARKARPGETWNEKTKTGADGTVGIDPALGQIGISCPPIVVNDVIIVGNSHIHGYYPIRLRNLPSYIRGFDVRTGKQLWKFNLVPEPGEFGADTWVNGTKPGTPGVGKVERVGAVLRRPGARARLHPGRHAADGRVRRTSPRRQPLRQQPRRARREDREAQVALPDGAPRHLGLRHADGAEPARCHDRRQAAEDHRAVDQAGLALRVRSRDRRADLADRRDAGARRATCPANRRRRRSRFRASPRRMRSRDSSKPISSTTRRRSRRPRSSWRRPAAWGRITFPRRLGDGTAPSGLTCSWYAPGASGGVNIDGGAAVDPETGLLYVAAQNGLSTMQLVKDPCSEFRYSSPHDSCGQLGALPPPPGYQKSDGRGGGRTAAANNIGGVSIVKPKELGGITAYNMSSGDKAWWIPNGGQLVPVETKDPLFAGVTLPPAAPGRGQAQIITTQDAGDLRHRSQRRAAERQAADLRRRQGDGQAGRRGRRSRRARARCR